MADTVTGKNGQEREALVQRLLAAADDVKTNPDDGASTSEAFAEIREELYRRELIRRTNDARKHPKDTIPMKQAFAELRREFGIAE